MFNDNAQTELIPMTLYLFILTAFVFTIAFVIPPAFQIIEQMSHAADPTGSVYYDVTTNFNLSVKMWYFVLVMIVVTKIIHMGLLALKKQRYTGVQHESDF
ncbi:MAG: hypothetical protein P1P69_04125 [Methanosarcinaceae archaeon]|nr:hypothetical protein [Methanosarcinaceae archaeon]